ncbi:MAG: TraE/TraK family type IV conjugative transfer system protein [Candidatus Omnitrophota bacterium]
MEHEAALRSKSSLYFERYGFAQRQNIAFGMTIYLLGGICVLLVIGLLMIAMRPKAIYYIPAAASAGMAYPERVPESSVISFSSAWLMDWVNYTPETVAGVYARSINFMAPGLLAKVRSGMDQELSKIARSQVSSVFMLKEAPRASEDARGFKVVFDGVRVVYAGKEELAREDVLFHVQVIRAAVTAQNPYGLVINDFNKDKVGSRHD